MISSNNSSLKLAVLIIAGGNSSRLGQPKQLVKFNGKSLIQKTIQLAREVHHSKHQLHDIVCVLGFQYQSILDTLQLDQEIIIRNSQWEIGMGTSIAAGIQSLKNQADAVLILLCDQYLLTLADVNQLTASWEENNLNEKMIIASQYQCQTSKKTILGAPAIFPKFYFDQLSQLTDKGARKILNNYSVQVIATPLKNSAFDLDTPQDLEQLQQNSSTNSKNSID